MEIIEGGDIKEVANPWKFASTYVALCTHVAELLQQGEKLGVGVCESGLITISSVSQL